MSRHMTGAARAFDGLTDHECRARRLDRQREALAHKLEALLVEIPDAITFDFNDLRHLAGYRNLEPEGLVHARILRPGRYLVILAATRRVLKNDGLRQRLFALRKLAETEFKRVLIASPTGLANAAGRLRAQRLARAEA